MGNQTNRRKHTTLKRTMGKMTHTMKRMTTETTTNQISQMQWKRNMESAPVNTPYDQDNPETTAIFIQHSTAQR